MFQASERLDAANSGLPVAGARISGLTGSGLYGTGGHLRENLRRKAGCSTDGGEVYAGGGEETL
jgi:hypothetical protein